METKKEGLQNYPENSFNSILNIFYRSGYRALDPEFGQNRIRNTDKVNYFPSSEVGNNQSFSCCGEGNQLKDINDKYMDIQTA